jgi:hypothetical protein
MQVDQDAGTKLLCTKVEVAGGPVFSLHPGFKPKIKDPNTKQSRPVVYCGLAAKEIAAWQPDALKFSEQVGIVAQHRLLPPAAATAVRPRCWASGCQP